MVAYSVMKLLVLSFARLRSHLRKSFFLHQVHPCIFFWDLDVDCEDLKRLKEWILFFAGTPSARRNCTDAITGNLFGSNAQYSSRQIGLVNVEPSNCRTVV